MNQSINTKRLLEGRHYEVSEIEDSYSNDACGHVGGGGSDPRVWQVRWERSCERQNRWRHPIGGMKMKRLILVFGILLPMVASAELPRSAISRMSVFLYGLYTTSDPTCMTGLVPTIPMKSTPVDFDMAKAPTLGNGPVAAPINCMAIVISNHVIQDYAAGSYTTTSPDGSDSVCNAGGSKEAPLCYNWGLGNQTVVWAPQIKTDVEAAGLTRTTSCTANMPTAYTSSTVKSQIIVLYFSTYSKCTGNVTLDAGVAGCVNTGAPALNYFGAPTAANSDQGMKLVAPTAKGEYTFVVDPDKTMGNMNLTNIGSSGNGCETIWFPTMSFK
jgi:hypothetical protein